MKALTKESILAMETGPELDALVSRLVMLDIPGQALIAPYSTSIASAWAVVEKMRIAVARLKHWDPERRRYDEAWWAKPLAASKDAIALYENTEGHTDSEIWFEEGDEASAETAPLAVCRAALLSTL